MNKEELFSVLQQVNSVTRFLLDHPLLVGLLARVLSRLVGVSNPDYQEIMLEELAAFRWDEP